MKLKILSGLFGIAAVILAAEAARMEARVYIESPEQAVARLGDLFGELDICTVDRTATGREFLVINTDTAQLAAIRAAGLNVEVTWADIRDKFRKMTGVDPDDLDAGRDFGYFFTYWEMIDTLRRLAALYPSIVDTFKLGPTYQNRVLWGLRISDNPTVDEPEPELFINGATHAREPLGTHACVNFASLLCEGYGSDSMVTWLVRNREFYIIPVMNPDGYVYNSDSGGSSSNWRKNRHGPVPPAVGVDLNRNYGYKWGYDNNGSSPTPSSETYRGPSRFSELETRLIRGLLDTHKFRTCQDFHTYGRYNLYAWGYRNPMPPDSFVLKEMGDTLEANNGYTQTGPIYRTIYPTNGGSTDYAQADTLKDSTSESKFITYGFSSELGRTDFWYGWNRPAYVDSEVERNVPNLYYLARVSGVFFDSMRVAVNDSAQGNRTNQLDPNETANLWFRVKNRAIHPLDSAYSISGRLRSLDTMVTVSDSIKTFPACRRRDSTDNRAAQFRVYCKKGTNPGCAVPLRLELTYKDDTLAMMQPVSFTITIGANPIYDHDVGCTRLLAPVGAVDSGASVVPACSVYNYGDVAESYAVRMRIGAYNQTATVTNHAAGSRVYVTFPTWTAGARGTYAVSCSTELASDTTRGNDKATDSVTVNVNDVACTRILAPTGSMDSGAVVAPACSVFNHGTTTPANYDVRMRIGAGYNQTATVADHPPGTAVYVTFPDWTAMPRGTYAVTCSTEFSGDQVAANDKATDSVTVNVNDVACTRILVPTGSVDSGAVVVPACSVYNCGTTGPGSYGVRMRIGAGYNQTATVADHPPGTAVYVTFPDWTATPTGTFAVTCSTELTRDQVAANDRATGTVDVVMSDIGAVAILAPAGTIPPGAVTPRATVHNYGTRRDAATVTFGIGPSYTETVTLAGGVPFADTAISFPTWTAAAGSYATRCSTWMATDQNAANNVIDGSVTVSAGGGAGWVQKSPMPAGAKAIKDGGWLAYDVSMARIYASRGQKQPDFFAYTPLGDSWGERAPWLPGTEGKLPGKGSAGCADGNGIIYATKGNNKPGFYKYDASADAWTQLKDVPLGLSNKKVKGGTDIVWALKDGVGYPYLLKGYKNEFYRYDTGEDSWQTLAPAPVGSNQKWDKGSWLAYDGVSTIYAHKSKYHEFYKYDTKKDSWSPALAGMPIPGSAGSKKSKDGGCGAFDGNHLWIYALKGGNTQEFWCYDIATNSWTERETIPAFGVTGRKKKVKAGADIVALGTDLYATKGNKSNELWMYTPGTWAAVPRPERSGVMAKRLAIGDLGLAISPNPLAAGFVHLVVRGTSLSRLASVQLYDAAGRCVGVWKPLLRSGAADLDMRHMAAGVYFVRFESDGFSATQKLVVQR